MRRALQAAALILLALLIIPVLIAQLRTPERRRFQWVSLEETRFREVSFRNQEQDLDLAGMLFVPRGDGPFPGAVIIHGSGASRRDSGWYLTLVRHLKESGIVVLLPDKRGSEKSQGDWTTASMEDLATDTVAAVDFLIGREEPPVSSVGVIGMSQGGRIAPLAASMEPRISFVVNVVGGAVPAREALVYEETNNLRQMGFLPGISDVLAYPAAWSLIHLRQKRFWDAVGNFDPLRWWRHVDAPSLVLYGEEDTNVPVARSVEALHSLAKPNIQVTVYEGSGHALESPRGEGTSIFREDALDEISSFIHSASGRRQESWGGGKR